MKKYHLLKVLSSLIVKFSDVQAVNFYFQVKFICYLISFTKKMALETGASLVLDARKTIAIKLLLFC